MAVRYALLAGHPRKQLNFTLDSLHAAESALNTLRKACARRKETHPNSRATYDVNEQIEVNLPKEAYFAPVLDHLRDDLNFPAALGSLFGLLGPFEFAKANEADLKSFDDVIVTLGLDLTKEAPKASAPASITALANQRWAAKQAKDFATADALRKDLATAGWSMLDRKDGYSLEPLKK
jgi:cysteinyl-tRNA synthetase